MRILVAVLLALFAAANAVAAPQGGGDEPLYRLRIEAASPPALQTALQAAGYDVLSIDTASSTVDVAASRAEWLALAATGYRVTVAGRGQPLTEILGSRSTVPKSRDGVSATAAAVPANYTNLDGILAEMQAIATAHPAIARLVDLTATLGTPPTAQGRHLYALKISDNVTVDEDESAVLLISAHHAREISTPLITLGAAGRLTAGYGTDARLTAAVNGHEIWIAPVWNPDGYAHVFATDNLWRKNRRTFSNGIGVDQNRNYPQGWSGSCAGSTSVSSETYKGPQAGSEAETQTLMAWSERERFAKVIDYHSYGREVLYGYLCSSHPFTAWMQQEAAALSVASGYGGATRAPSAEGEQPEWQFSRMGAYAFLIETHTQFQPSYESALTEATRVWPGILTVLDRPISISGHVTDARTGAPLSAKIEVLNVTFTNGETNSSGGRHGAFHMFLPAGTYDVRFSAPGFTPETRQVTVTATSATVVDVALAGVPPSPPTNIRIVGGSGG